MKFRDRLMRFMQGRNGADEFARFASGAGFVLILVALVFTIFATGFSGKNDVAATVFRVLHWITYGCGALMIGYSLFRMFSRNVYKRQTENTRFLYRKNKLRRKWEGLKERWQNRKTHRYIRCPKCRQQLRVPRNKGKIRVTCSKCGEKFIIKT